MQADFWHQKWERNEIAFHQAEANPFLVRHFDALALAEGSRVFLPLCGKTRDIHWLLSRGYHVVGAELSRIAVEQLFAELGVEAAVTERGALTHFSAEHIDIFVGDIFDLTGTHLGGIHAVYDRAALVALPESTRVQYTAHLMAITSKAAQLLICFEYDQSQLEGPPFSITPHEVGRHYDEHYGVTLLEDTPVPGGLKGICPAKETVWLLKN